MCSPRSAKQAWVRLVRMLKILAFPFLLVVRLVVIEILGPNDASSVFRPKQYALFGLLFKSSTAKTLPSNLSARGTLNPLVPTFGCFWRSRLLQRDLAIQIGVGAANGPRQFESPARLGQIAQAAQSTEVFGHNARRSGEHRQEHKDNRLGASNP